MLREIISENKLNPTMGFSTETDTSKSMLAGTEFVSPDNSARSINALLMGLLRYWHCARVKKI